MSLVFNKGPLAYSRSAGFTWGDDICSSKINQTKEYPLKPAKARDSDIQLNLPSNEMPRSINTLCHDSSRLLPSKGTIAEALNPGLLLPHVTQHYYYYYFFFNFRLNYEMVSDCQALDQLLAQSYRVIIWPCQDCLLEYTILHASVAVRKKKKKLFYYMIESLQ